jgi:hypothetical protein
MLRASKLVRLLVPLLAVRAAQAQAVYSVEAGGTSVSYGNAPRASGFSISPSLRLEQPRSSLLASGNLSLFDAGGWSGQGFVSASLFSQPGHLVRGELAATASGILYEHSGRGMSLVSEGRVHLAGSSIGAWLGAGFGGLGTQSSSGPIIIADVGAWRRLGAAMITMSLTRSEFRSNDVSSLPSLGASDVFDVKPVELGSRDRRLYDLTTTMHWERGILELDATAGARLPSRTDDARRWGSLGVGVWISKSAALVVRGGSDPANATYGFPSVRYASIGVRFTAPSARARPTPRVRAAAARDGDFTLLSGAGNVRTLRVVAPGAAQVELMGDFTSWDTVRLNRVAKDTWEATLRIEPGTYRMSVRVDGGAWGAPPGIPAQGDEFNGEVGVVVVR